LIGKVYSCREAAQRSGFSPEISPFAATINELAAPLAALGKQMATCQHVIGSHQTRA